MYNNRTLNIIRGAYQPFTRGFVEAGVRQSLESQLSPGYARGEILSSDNF